MKYFLIALFAIGLGFGVTKVVAMLAKQSVTPEVQNQPVDEAPVTEPVSNEPASNAVVSEIPVEQPLNVPQGSEIDNTAVTVSFVGIQGANTYEGSFHSVDSNLRLISGVVAGSITVDTTSLITNIPAATANWQSKTSFNTAAYPTASFSFTSWKKEVEPNMFAATGKLTVRGITKVVHFPVTYTNGAYVTQFLVKAADFGFKSKLVSDIQFNITVPTK